MGAWGRDLCQGTCKDGSTCLNLVSDDELYCRHHKDQMTAEDRRELQWQKKKDAVVVVVGLVFFILLVVAAALG